MAIALQDGDSAIFAKATNILHSIIRIAIMLLLAVTMILTRTIDGSMLEKAYADNCVTPDNDASSLIRSLSQ